MADRMLTVEIRGVRHMVEPEGWPYNRDLVVLRCGGYTNAPDAAPGVPTCLFCWGSLRRWEHVLAVADAAGVSPSKLKDTVLEREVYNNNKVHRETT